METKSNVIAGDDREVMIHHRNRLDGTRIIFRKAISDCSVGNNIRYAVRVTNGNISEDALIGMTRTDMKELLYKVGQLIGE